MKVIIVEDEKLAAEKLEQLLLEYNPDIQVLARFESVSETVAWLETHSSPDLLFLDIHLADGSGFQLFEFFAVNFPVVFTTAYDQYAINAFEVSGVGYLLKPVTLKNLSKCLHNLEGMKLIFSQTGEENLKKIVQQIRGEKQFKNRFLVKSGEKIVAVHRTEIAYFLAESKFTFLVTHQNQRFLIEYPLDELEDLLDPDEFFRINRKFLCSREAITEIYAYFKGRSKLILSPAQQEKIVVSSEKNAVFRAWMEK
jgi:two-component system, LytTR family, response regulator LytT